MSVSPAHCQTMVDVGRFADEQWMVHGKFIAGATAYESVVKKGINSSHPSFPIFMYQLGLMPMASNGAAINLWGSPDPVCLCVLNVNHSQTRKSRLTGEAEMLSGFADEACSKAFNDIWDTKVRVLSIATSAKRRRVGQADGDAADPLPPDDANEKVGVFPGTMSVAFLGGTIERVRERCAGDCHMVRQTKAATCE